MLSQSMKHVVEETNSSVDSNLLGLAGLGSMAIIVVEKTRIGVRREIAAVKVEGELDLGLVGVTSESSPSELSDVCLSSDCMRIFFPEVDEI
ncbi:unnamed protein product [Fusarium graminearum]|nr:unnamed protein product [Fusarium graminearum]